MIVVDTEITFSCDDYLTWTDAEEVGVLESVLEACVSKSGYVKRVR